jgi:hypothetical protein
MAMHILSAEQNKQWSVHMHSILFSSDLQYKGVWTMDIAGNCL